MPTPHVIRLRAPWECRPLDGLAGASATRPIVRCTRRFNAPTNLDPADRVWLECDAVERGASFTLNGRHLATIGTRSAGPRIDLTDALAPHNRLVIDVEIAPDATPPRDAHTLPGGIGEVRLEIVSTTD